MSAPRGGTFTDLRAAGSLVALLPARGVPAVLYRPMVGDRHSLAAGLLQATSLPFIVAATGIGMDLGLLSPAVGCSRWYFSP